jgi:hypothetical protein
MPTYWLSLSTLHFHQIGTPTILINGAAIVNGKPLLELSAEEVEQ